MASGDWTDQQNDAIVADYFAMLADDEAGRLYSKAEHNRRLQEAIGRPRGSIEYKHQNISAVLKGLGEDWIPGYKPAFNFQGSLVDAVTRWLAAHPAWLSPDTRLSLADTAGLSRVQEARCGSGRRRRSATCPRRTNSSRCSISPGVSTLLSAMPATARWAARARSGSSFTNDRH